MPTQTRGWSLSGALLAAVAAFPRPGAAQPVVPLRPGTTLFQLDLAGTPVGDAPNTIKVLKGNVEVVLLGGMRMLKASTASEFLITLAQVLPTDFTLEFDLVPKLGSNPQDLSFEGTPTINQGTASAHVLWHATGSLSVIGGGGDNYETPMPDDLRATLPGVLTRVVLEAQGPTIKLYTNGRRLYTLQKQFARGAVLRVFLGAEDGGTEAVHLAGLRVTAGAQVIAQGNPAPPAPPGTSNYVPPLPGSQSQQPPQTATNQFALTGGPGSGTIAVSVTLGANGPLVSWPPVAGAAGYTVSRSKSDDLNCCNAVSGRTWGATSPWQDSPLPVPGTYVYTVMATTRTGGQAQGQTQFNFGISSVAAGPQVIAPPGGSAGLAPSSFAVTVTLGSGGPVVSWPAVPNATDYAVGRWKIDDANCCNNSSGRGWGASSPWQDQPLPLSGTYVYRVAALTAAGTVTAVTQFGFRMPGGIASTSPPPATAVPASPPTATMAVPPAPAPAPAPPPSSSTILTPTRPSGVSPNSSPASNTGLAPTPVSVTGTPNTAQVVWNQPWSSNATYRVRRAVQGSGSFSDLTPTPLTVNFFDDVLPNPGWTYTYEVTALYPDGTAGTATADFTPPAPSDPTGFKATVTGIDEVELSWDAGTPGKLEFFISGPGTGNGVTVPGTVVQIPVHPHRLFYTVKGVPAGTHTWKIASSYLPGGVLTTPAQWPAATASLAATKYRVTLFAFDVTTQSREGLALDGFGDEVYLAAFVGTQDLATQAWGPKGAVRSVVFGDVTGVSGRVLAGTASLNGGLKSSDVFPVGGGAAAAAPPNSNGVPMLLWEGTLSDDDLVLIAPSIWESDGNDVNYAEWVRHMDAVLPRAVLWSTMATEIAALWINPVKDRSTTNSFSVTGPVVDHPIGMTSTIHYSQQYLALTRRRIEAALSSSRFGGLPPGVIQITVTDETSMTNFGGWYRIFVRVERVP